MAPLVVLAGLACNSNNHGDAIVGLADEGNLVDVDVAGKLSEADPRRGLPRQAKSSSARQASELPQIGGLLNGRVYFVSAALF